MTFPYLQVGDNHRLRAQQRGRNAGGARPSSQLDAAFERGDDLGAGRQVLCEDEAGVPDLYRGKNRVGGGVMSSKVFGSSLPPSNT